MAPENPADSKIKPLQRTMFFDSLYRISGTGRRKPAGRRSKRRDAGTVEINRKQQQERAGGTDPSLYLPKDAGDAATGAFHKKSFSEMRKSAVFIFASSSAVDTRSSER